MAKKPKEPKGREDEPNVYSLQLSAPGIRADVEALAELIERETGVPSISKAMAVSMAVREALARRRGKA